MSDQYQREHNGSNEIKAHSNDLDVFLNPAQGSTKKKYIFVINNNT